MLTDYDVQRCTHRCAIEERELLPGEVFYSALFAAGAQVERRDYCQQAWTEPPADAIGWWKARIGVQATNKPKLAPNEVLLALFGQWADEADRADARYVLALLLVRRRVFRLEEPTEWTHQAPTDGTLTDQQPAAHMLKLFSPKQDCWHEVVVATPSAERIEAIQAELFELLYADSK